MNIEFKVKIGEFEGPLDLLLSLIEERKMHVSEVSITQVADEFIQYVRGHESFPASQTANFILIAATLLLMKSKALLPVFKLTDDEEEDIKDLELRLSLYKVYRDIAKNLGNLKDKLYFGGLKRDNEPIFSPSNDMTVENLHSYITNLLTQVPKIEKKDEVNVSPVVTLEEMMTNLAQRVEKVFTMTFKDFVGSPEDRREIVVGFLAVLELVKRGFVTVEQSDKFSDITMNYSGNPGKPRYD